MPSNGRWDLIRRLKLNHYAAHRLNYQEMYRTLELMILLVFLMNWTVRISYVHDHVTWLFNSCLTFHVCSPPFPSPFCIRCPLQDSVCYLLTPWCRVLLEKLIGLQLVKKFPAFLGTRKFITTFTSFRHPSLSWASPIQSTCPQPTSWRSILILSNHLRLGLPSGLFPSGFIYFCLFYLFIYLFIYL